MKKLFTPFILCSVFINSVIAQNNPGCFNEYMKKFEKNGAYTVPDGMQNVIIGVITIGGGNNCIMGKVLVKEGKVELPVYIVEKNGELIKPNDTLNRLFYRQSHDENRLFNIDDGMSATFVTEKNRKARLFFIDYLKPDRGGFVKPASVSAVDIEKVTLDSKSIQFNTGKDVITPQSYTSLDAITAVILSNPGSQWMINGYTDNVGSENSNLILSKKRADAVKKYLVRKGVDKDVVTAVGYGVDQPIADNNTPEGRALNRRVEIVPVK